MNAERFKLEPGASSGSDNKREIPRPEAPPREVVTDPHRLAQRQKQIDYGKNTIGYDNYTRKMPRHRRRFGKDPMTPDITDNCSKRAFDGRVKVWRKSLHEYDGPDGSRPAGASSKPAAQIVTQPAESAGIANVDEEHPPKLADDIDQLLAGLKEDDGGDLEGEDLQAMTNKLLEELSDDESGNEGEGAVQSIYES